MPYVPVVADWLVDKFGGGSDSAYENMYKFIDGVHLLESSRGKNLENPKSNAEGDFQFMNTPDDELKEDKINAYQVANNRTRDTMRAIGVPWDYEGIADRGSPLFEPYSVQEDMFLSDLYQKGGKGVTNELFKRIMEGDSDAAVEMYSKYHHTKPEKKTIKKALDIFSGLRSREKEQEEDLPVQEYRGGGLIRDAYGRTLI